VIHELMTNAAKYGALSDGGRINIEWGRSEGGKVALRGRGHVEGKKVAPPGERGFGLNVIENGMTYATDGRAHVVFEPEGLCWEAEIPSVDHD